MVEKSIKINEEGNASYPAYTIEDCISRVKIVSGHRGIGGAPATQKEIAIMLGKAEGTLILMLSSCRQYGLMNNIHGKGYVVDDLFQQIEAPVYGEQGRKSAMLEAFSNPPLNKKLIEQFNGKILPNEEGLGNLLKSKAYRINENSVKRAVKVFFDTGRSLGIIDPNNRLAFLPAAPGSGNGQTEQNSQPQNKPQEVSQPTSKVFELPIDLTGDKMAYLKYPKGDMTLEDIDMLEVMVKATIRALKARHGVKDTTLNDYVKTK